MSIPSNPCISTYELVLAAGNIGDIHVVGGWAEIFELLASEDVDGDEMDLGVTVLAGLGGGHVDNLAGAVLDHDEPVLAESRTLHGISGRGTGIGALKGVLMLLENAISKLPWSRHTPSSGAHLEEGYGIGQREHT
jgi:hypothetical protein